MLSSFRGRKGLKNKARTLDEEYTILRLFRLERLGAAIILLQKLLLLFYGLVPLVLCVVFVNEEWTKEGLFEFVPVVNPYGQW